MAEPGVCADCGTYAGEVARSVQHRKELWLECFLNRTERLQQAESEVLTLELLEASQRHFEREGVPLDSREVGHRQLRGPAW